jgi:hypothetical protein
MKLTFNGLHAVMKRVSKYYNFNYYTHCNSCCNSCFHSERAAGERYIYLKHFKKGMNKQNISKDQKWYLGYGGFVYFAFADIKFELEGKYNCKVIIPKSTDKAIIIVRGER